MTDVVPRCRHAGVCGGCDWQHVAYREQLAAKRDRLVHLLEAATGGASRHWRVEPTVPTRGERPAEQAADPKAPWGFRRKVHFVWLAGPRGVDLGHYARGGRSLVPVDECPVHDARGNAIAFAIRDVMREHGVTAVDPRLQRGTLRHLVVRASGSDPQALATLVVTNARDPRLTRALAALAPGRAGAVGLHVNVHAGRSSYLFGPETRRVSGAGHVREVVGGLSFLVPPTSFFQTNTEAASALVALVRQAAAGVEARSVLDLYAGVGLFALTLAASGLTVTAVEGDEAAVRQGRAAAGYHGLAGRCRWVRAPAQTFLRQRAAPGYDVVIVDPPRAGLAAQEIEGWLGRVAPARFVYVSCDPESLARDLASATRSMANGRVPRYRVEAVVPVDMFPHTTHLESVVVMTRDDVNASPWPGPRPSDEASAPAAGESR
ncbi:MAG: 23S rRNA (uracil(1939)-C(5))-methyltransferase RlmD [Vicinamibacteraceae bacterium]|nr:23S rRNA (uracil(1939)-C(5))-methyltransferase RlmD [Vicinamibacteraceae bacterium]